MRIPKYTNDELNPYYVSYLEDKIKSIQNVVRIAETIAHDQTNGITEGEICISTLKDIRKDIKGIL